MKSFRLLVILACLCTQVNALAGGRGRSWEYDQGPRLVPTQIPHSSQTGNPSIPNSFCEQAKIDGPFMAVWLSVQAMGYITSDLTEGECKAKYLWPITTGSEQTPTPLGWYNLSSSSLERVEGITVPYVSFGEYNFRLNNQLIRTQLGIKPAPWQRTGFGDVEYSKTYGSPGGINIREGDWPEVSAVLKRSKKLYISK